jgi:hypothetical protein
VWPGGARCGPTCRSAVPAAAEYGLIGPWIWGRWLPVRLPRPTTRYMTQLELRMDPAEQFGRQSHWARGEREQPLKEIWHGRDGA